MTSLAATLHVLQSAERPLQLHEIQARVNALTAPDYHSESAIGARTRDLRKAKYGGHNVEQECRSGKYVYWLVVPKPTQQSLFA